MTTITAAAGGGNWSVGGTWVGGIAPTAADDVLLTVTSGNVTIDGTSGSPNLCRSLVCTGYTGTLTQASAKVLNIGDGTAGALTLVAGMTYAPNSGSTINFISTTTGNNITLGGKTLGIVNFNGVGGAWTFASAFASAGLTTLTSGTLSTGNQTVATSNGFNASGSLTRTLTLGSSVWTNTGNWDITNSTNLTFNANTSTINITLSNSLGFLHNTGLTYNTVSITQVNNTGNITGANTYANLTLTASAVLSCNFSINATQTVTTAFAANGNSAINRLLIRSDVLGTGRTISAASVSCTYLDMRDITGAGAGSWNLSAITGLSGDCGGNSGITFTTGINCYMKTAVSVNWSASNWYTTSGGSTPARVPLPQDSAIFDANSVTAGSKIITGDMPRMGSVNWTGVLNTPAWTKNAASVEVYGSVVMVSGMTLSGSATTYTLMGRSSYNFTSGTQSWQNPLIVNALGGTYTFTDAFTAAAGLTFTVTAGTLTTSSTMSLIALTMNGGTLNLGGTLTLTGAVSITSAVVLGSSFIVTGATTFSMSGTAPSFSVGTLTLSSTATLTNGDLTIGSGGLSCTTFSSSNSNTRSITMGSGTWTLSGTGTVWDTSTATGLTVTPNSSTINISNTSATSKTFSGGGKTFGNITFTGDNITVAGSNGWANFGINNAGLTNGLKLTAGTTQTVTGLTTNGFAANLAKLLSTSTTNAIISCANPVDVDYMSIADSTAAGNVPFYAGNNSTDAGGGNVNWTFTPRPPPTIAAFNPYYSRFIGDVGSAYV